MESVRVLLCAVLSVLLSCSRFPSAEASRMKSVAALPIQPEREPVPSKGVSGKYRRVHTQRCASGPPHDVMKL